MPNPLNNRKHQQWQECARCGRMFPMGQLTKQKGMLLCTKGCLDDLTPEIRQNVIEQILGASSEQQEGVDTRVIDTGFFEGDPWTQQ